MTGDTASGDMSSEASTSVGITIISNEAPSVVIIVIVVHGSVFVFAIAALFSLAITLRDLRLWDARVTPNILELLFQIRH
jgi:hypothetical protein